MIKITGLKTDLKDAPAEFVTTTTNDPRFFFMVEGNDKEMNTVHFRVFVDGKMAFEGGTNLDADGKQNVVFEMPAEFRTPGEYEIAIELFERDDLKPDEDKELIDSAFYTLYLQ